MKKLIAGLVAILLLISCCGCSNTEEETDPFVSAYMQKAQEFIDAGELDSAAAVLEEGIKNTNAPELTELLEQVQKTVEEQTTEPVEETEPQPDFSAYLGLWANEKCRMELTASSEELFVNMKCLSYRVLEHELDMSAKISEQEEGKVRLPFDDDGLGNSGVVVLYLDGDVINYVITDYVAVSDMGIQTQYGGGSLTRVDEGTQLNEIQPAETEPETEPAEPSAPADESTRPNYGGSEYLGKWVDTWSQRATMEIEKNDGYYGVTIRWSNGASETHVWRMWAVDAEGGSLFSTNCEKTVEYCDEYGNSTVYVIYTEGEATIYIYDGYLYWNDYTEDAGQNCCFEKVS